MATPLGARLRDLRDARKWTQGQLATYARVERSWLSLVETGRIENPRAADLIRVARALGTSVEYLVTGTEPPGPTDARSAALLRQWSRFPYDVLSRIDATLGVWIGHLEPEEDATGSDSDSEHDEQEPP